jgi:hypothetical protein
VIGIVIKGVTNPNGVSSGATCTTIGQNRARTPNIVQYKVTDEDGRAEKKWEGDLIQQTGSTVTLLVQH